MHCFTIVCKLFSNNVFIVCLCFTSSVSVHGVGACLSDVAHCHVDQHESVDRRVLHSLTGPGRSLKYKKKKTNHPRSWAPDHPGNELAPDGYLMLPAVHTCLHTLCCQLPLSSFQDSIHSYQILCHLHALISQRFYFGFQL